MSVCLITPDNAMYGRSLIGERGGVDQWCGASWAPNKFKSEKLRVLCRHSSSKHDHRFGAIGAKQEQASRLC